MKKHIILCLLLFSISTLMAEKQSLDIGFEKLNHKGMCTAWVNHKGAAFQPAPKVAITKENGKNVIHFSEIKGKSGFSWATRGRFPAVSGDRVVVTAKVKGSGKFTFGIQTLDGNRRWTNSRKHDPVTLTPNWQQVVMDFQIYNTHLKKTSFILLDFYAVKDSELYITDVKADLYRYSDKAESKDAFIPTPVDCKNNGEVVYAGNKFYIENKAAVPESSLNWLAAGMKRVLGWECAASEKDAMKISYQTLAAKKNRSQEYYELTIGKDGIAIKAATREGFFRGTGRLMGIVESKQVKNVPEKGFAFPAIEMKDFPVIADRAFMLQIEGASPALKTLKDWRKLYYRHIDVAAMLGYNTIFINFGGRMELKKHPELVWRNFRSHTQEEIKKIIAYASGLGMKVYPMTSAIGHYKSGYQIFPISQEKVPNINGALVKAAAMNVGHPQFYKIFFEVLDEICEVFNNPEYIMIRSDEFFTETPMLEKYTGKKCIDFYSEFLNRTAKYAEKRGAKIIVCQDMWVPARTPGEESNGPKDAEKLLDMVDKNVSICYWRYDFSPLKWLGKFHSKGFKDLWVMPWYDPEPTRLLITEGHKYGAKVFAGIWSEPGQNNGLPAIAEYAWNPYAKPYQQHRLNNYCDQLFYSRNTKIAAKNTVFAELSGGIPADQNTMKQLQAVCKEDSGIPVDFSQAKVFQGKSEYEKVITVPDLIALCKSGELKNYSFGIKGSPVPISFTKNGLNKARGAQELVIYTPAWGKSTRSNIYGTEFALKGDVVQLTDARCSNRDALPTIGNFPILKDCLTLSRHGMRLYDNTRHLYRNSNMLAPLIKSGAKLDFYKKVPGTPASGKITIKLSGKRNCAVIYLQASGFIEKFSPVALITAKTADGKKITDSVDSFRWHISGYHQRKNVLYYLPWQDELQQAGIAPVIAVEIFSDSPLTYMEIAAQGFAANAGLVVLGVTEHQK